MKGIINAGAKRRTDGSFTVRSKIVLPLGDGGECALSEYPTTCAICGALIKNVHESHNPYPLSPIIHPHEEQKGIRCCATCNVTQVLPARFSSRSPNSGKPITSFWT